MTDASARRALLLRVHGRVQGVAFRASMEREARALGLSGWARNRADGTVEACIVGPHAQVERMLAWVKRGPSMARVERVDCEPVDPPPGSGHFEIRSTV